MASISETIRHLSSQSPLSNITARVWRWLHNASGEDCFFLFVNSVTISLSFFRLFNIVSPTASVNVTELKQVSEGKVSQQTIGHVQEVPKRNISTVTFETG